MKIEKITVNQGNFLWWDKLEVNIKFSHIPDNVCSFYLKLSFTDSDDKNVAKKHEFIIKNGYSVFNSETYIASNAAFGWLFDQEIHDDITVNLGDMKSYKVKENRDTEITQYTANVTTTTKLDIAVEEAKTWYGNIAYENKMKGDTLYETVKSVAADNSPSGNRFKIDTPNPTAISSTKPKIVIERNDSNKDTIFAEKGIGDYAWAEIGARIEKWYQNLEADQVGYWLTLGPLTRELYDHIIGGDHGFQLGTEDELLNIRLTYAKHFGIGDFWQKKYYMPVKATFEASDYEIDYLWTTVDRFLTQGVPVVQENEDFFLGLLKNSSGTYKIVTLDEDGNEVVTYPNYDADGKEVVYKDIYGNDARVVKFFENAEEMLYELLDSSQDTEAITPIMKLIMYKYHNGIEKVVEWEFNTTVDGKEFITIKEDVAA